MAEVMAEMDGIILLAMLMVVDAVAALAVVGALGLTH